jgi:hypothetical protein
VLNLMGAAGAMPSLAHVIANNFNNPPDYFPWWEDPAECERFIAQHAPAVAA